MGAQTWQLTADPTATRSDGSSVTLSGAQQFTTRTQGTERCYTHLASAQIMLAGVEAIAERISITLKAPPPAGLSIGARLLNLSLRCTSVGQLPGLAAPAQVTRNHAWAVVLADAGDASAAPGGAGAYTLHLLASPATVGWQ